MPELHSIPKEPFSNWSRDIRFIPQQVVAPNGEAGVKQVIGHAMQYGLTIRSFGARHSCSRIFETDEILMDTSNLKGEFDQDMEKKQVTLGAGMTVEEAGECLFKKGLGMENTGHINQQTLAGAMSTGTHGAGKTLKSLSGQMAAVTLVTGTGDIRTYNETQDPEMMQALRVSLGCFGIFTRITLKALPAFQLHRRQYCAGTEDCLGRLDELMSANRNFCFYWYPRRDDVSIRLWNEPGKGSSDLPFARLYKEYTGWGKDVLPTDQQLRFNELEYAFAADAAPACFRALRERVLQKHRQQVAWRILFRPVAADDAWLSNAYERDIVAITVHQHADLPYQEYFSDAESIFREHGGRPHWGKKHSLTAADLRKLYPKWDAFQQLRADFDPHGIFLNKYLRQLFHET